jgi:hypothetical protein
MFTLSLEGFRARQLVPAPQPLRETSVRSASPRYPPSCSFDFSLSTPNRSSRMSPYQFHLKGLSYRLFSYSYALFCTVQNAISCRFKPFHTLYTKHPGWGMPVTLLSADLPRTRPASAQQRPFTPRVVGEGQPIFIHGVTSHFSGYPEVGGLKGTFYPANGAEAEAFSICVNASCPHAAITSRPREYRVNTGTPRSSKIL